MVWPTLYEGIFLGTLSTCVLPLPEEAALLAAGYGARLGRVSLGGALGAAWLAVMVGDTLGYATGRFLLSTMLRTRFGEAVFPLQWRSWAEEIVARHGAGAVFFARFLVGLRGFVYFAVGASRMPVARFLAVNGAAAVLEVGGLVGAGYAFGAVRERYVAEARGVDIAVASLVALALAGPVIARARARRRS